MKNRIEILAPAGGFESLEAAAKSGADAVYLGAKDFSARKSAQNFSSQELKDAVAYCHARGMKAYLTVNTLMFDSEIQSALDLICDAYSSGIDAVIIQDIGLASYLRHKLPELRLHASTQMSVHTLSGAKALQEMGFSRVVLSRELSLDEIREIAEGCDIELEVFVHGALCMSVSGQCYFSAMLGSRSGNRGMCAQPCRLPFSLKGGSPYALSLKDNSLVSYIKDLEKIGVTSAKIEGRMKRPEYVASATRACKESRDAGFVSDDTNRHLEAVFSRTGFTDGYLCGKRNGDMFGYRRKEDVTASNEKLLREIRNTYKNELPRIGVSFEFCAKLSQCPTLVATDGKNTVTVTSQTICEKALNLPLSQDKVSALLTKLGGTEYYADKINCSIDEGISLPASAVNELRRNALAELTQLRAQSSRPRPTLTAPCFENSGASRTATHSRARFTDCDVPDDFLECDIIFVPLTSKAEELENLMARGFTLGVEIPRGMFGKENRIRKDLESAKNLGINHVLAGNLGAVYLAKSMGFCVHGGFGLNITNTLSVMWAQETGLADIELSFELKSEQIAALGGDIPRGILAAGYLPLMLTRLCPGYTKGASCAKCNKKHILQDRMQKNFIFSCDGICTEILNCVPLLIPDKIKAFKGIDFYEFRFSVENSVEKVENIRSFSSKNQISKDFTRGLYYRGVK